MAGGCLGESLQRGATDRRNALTPRPNLDRFTAALPSARDEVRDRHCEALGCLLEEELPRRLVVDRDGNVRVRDD